MEIPGVIMLKFGICTIEGVGYFYSKKSSSLFCLGSTEL